MVTVIAILMLLVCFNFLLKQTFGTWKGIAVYTMLIAVFTISTWQIAINQSRTHIAEWLASETIMQNMAVILSVDIIVNCFFVWLQRGKRQRCHRLPRFVKKYITLYYNGGQALQSFLLFLPCWLSAFLACPVSRSRS